MGSLNALELIEKSCRFVLDTPNPLLPGPGQFILDIGGAEPFTPLALVFTLSLNVPCTTASSMNLNNICFPDYYLGNVVLTFLVPDAQGFASVNAAIFAVEI